MRTLILILCGIAAIAFAGSTIDRIVAVVGKRAIKQTDLERDLRVTQFLNGDPINSTLPLQKKALERLIDQELIRSEMGTASNTNSAGKEAQALYDQVARERFGGSKEKLTAELRRRGLKETELLQQLQWQLVVLRFIDERFRPGAIAIEEEMRDYYEEHRKELTQRPGDHSFESLEPQIRETLEANTVDRLFDDWLTQQRRMVLIDYKVDELK